MKAGERDLRACIHHLLHAQGWTEDEVREAVARLLIDLRTHTHAVDQDHE